jgi:hypothetical protein
LLCFLAALFYALSISKYRSMWVTANRQYVKAYEKSQSLSSARTKAHARTPTPEEDRAGYQTSSALKECQALSTQMDDAKGQGVVLIVCAGLFSLFWLPAVIYLSLTAAKKNPRTWQVHNREN